MEEHYNLQNDDDDDKDVIEIKKEKKDASIIKIKEVVSKNTLPKTTDSLSKGEKLLIILKETFLTKLSHQLKS